MSIPATPVSIVALMAGVLAGGCAAQPADEHRAANDSSAATHRASEPIGGGPSRAPVDAAESPPPRIRAWMDRLTVDHEYDPSTGFIVAREVIDLPPVIANGPALDEAIELAELEGRVVIAVATADRCAPCQEYKKTALRDPRVVEFLGRRGVLATHIEVDREPELARAHLGGLMIPMTYAIYNGERIATLRGQRSPDELATWLTEVVEMERSEQLDRSTKAWHDGRLDRLTAEDGWLTLVGLEWLGEGDGRHRVGRDVGGGVVYSGFPHDHVGDLVRRGERIRFEPTSGVEIEGLPDDGFIASDADGRATVLRVEGVRFHVIERGGQLAVRIRDEDAPTRAGFRGIERYAVDERWRILAEFEPAAPSSTIGLGTVVGFDTESEVMGIARFEIDGHRVEAALFPSSGGRATLRFADATNGGGTYPIGRYLSVPPPRADGTVLLDFNRSYSPPCAFTPFATCVIAPDANTWAFEVDAGERWSPGE